VKFGEAVSLVGEQYMDESIHEGGDSLVTDPGTMKQVLDDFALYCKYTRDADVHDELTPDNVGTDRLHVLTEEEYITVFDIVNDWLTAFRDEDDFEDDTELDEHTALVESADKWMKRAVEDRGGNVDGD